MVPIGQDGDAVVASGMDFEQHTLSYLLLGADDKFLGRTERASLDRGGLNSTLRGRFSPHGRVDAQERNDTGYRQNDAQSVRIYYTTPFTLIDNPSTAPSRKNQSMPKMPGDHQKPTPREGHRLNSGLLQMIRQPWVPAFFPNL